MPDLNGEPRVIRVGFLLPRTYEVDPEMIYVVLRRHGSDIGARAVSNKLFSYFTEKDKVFQTKEVNNERGSGREGLPICEPHYEELIRRLAEQNKANIIDACKEDGATLVRRLEEIKRTAEVNLIPR